MREGLGFAVGLLLRLWLATLRLRLVVAPELEGSVGPWVLAFFHGTQFPLLAWPRRRDTSVLVSLSADGAWLAGVLRALGFSLVRGSSSRGASRAVAALLRRGTEGHDLAFAVDGPRGPRGVAKAGAGWTAKRLAGTIVPMGAAVSWGTIFSRSWDGFALAWPFSRIAVVLGPPVDPDASPAAVSEAIAAVNASARNMLNLQDNVSVR